LNAIFSPRIVDVRNVGDNSKTCPERITHVHARLSDLHQRTQTEIARIENLRCTANGTLPSN
jgi:hypothetical protein